MSKQLVFYTNPQSRGRIVRWMLEETGADYEMKILGYETDLKSADYLAVNPMGKIPAIRHGDTVVTECAAICAYLADAFPDAGLAPAPADRGLYYRWLFFAAGPVEAAITNNAMGFEVPAERQRMAGYGNFDLTMDTLEKAVTANRFVAGGKFSAADVYVGSHIGWGMQFGTMPKRAAFEDYWARVSDRDAYRRGSELDDKAAAEQA